MALAAIWLHHDRARHMRMNVAEVFVGAGRGEREREAAVRVERLRLEQIARRGDRMRRVRIEPSSKQSGGWLAR